jgi:hypothetical protein
MRTVKNEGFISLPVIIGGAVLALGLIGGAIYELNANNSSSALNSGKLTADTSSAFYHTGDTPASFAVKVISPNGGESFKKGDNILIKWSGGKNKVEIGLVNSAGGILGWITSTADPNGSLEWDGSYVKDLVGSAAYTVPSGAYKIIAVSANSLNNYCFGCADGGSFHGRPYLFAELGLAGGCPWAARSRLVLC